MDAALKSLRAGCIEVLLVRLAWRDEIVGLQCQAFWCRDGVAGQIVERRDNASAEGCDMCERMNFSATIHRKERLTDGGRGHGRREVPRASLLVPGQLGDEVGEGHATLTDAGSWSDSGVECGRVARIAHVNEALRTACVGIADAGTRSER